MDYWSNFLKKRADEDMAMYDTFEISRNLHLKDIFVKIKDGKLKFSNIRTYMQYRIDVVHELISKMDYKNMPDCELPIYIGDSYPWEDKNIHFSFSKADGKKGLLFPCWEFMNWDGLKKKFVDNYIPWTERERGPYFIGMNTSSRKTNIRQIIKNLYPDNVRLLEENNYTYYEPPTNLMKYKTVFELAGNTPWSGRSVVVALSGCSSIRLHNYYTKWGEKPWIQFYEDPETFTGIHLDANYNIPFPESKIPILKDAIDKEIEHAMKRHARAKAIRERMMKLTTDHIVQYLEYIFTEVGKKQNI